MYLKASNWVTISRKRSPKTSSAPVASLRFNSAILLAAAAGFLFLGTVSGRAQQTVTTSLGESREQLKRSVNYYQKWIQTAYEAQARARTAVATLDVLIRRDAEFQDALDAKQQAVGSLTGDELIQLQKARQIAKDLRAKRVQAQVSLDKATLEIDALVADAIYPFSILPIADTFRLPTKAAPPVAAVQDGLPVAPTLEGGLSLQTPKP